MNYPVILLFVNLIFFAAVAVYFLRVRKQLQEEQKEGFAERKFDDERIERAEMMLKEELAEVRERAQTILSESQHIAEELVGELEKVLNKNHTDISIEVPQGSAFELELGEFSRNLKNRYVIRIQNLLKSLEKYELSEAKKVHEFALSQQDLTSKSLTQMRNEMLERIRARIDRYKEEEISLFDSKVKKVVDEAAIEVLGHSLTNAELEEMLSKAIDVARKKHMI